MGSAELALGGLVAAVLLVEWRLGMLLVLAVGFLQDPLRKLVPGEPVYLTAAVAVAVAALVVAARVRGLPLSFRPIHRWNGALRVPLALFIGLVVLQSGVTLVRTGSLILAGLGCAVYLAPLPALLLAYSYVRTPVDITRFLRWYTVLGLVMASGIYLAYAGFDWPVLGQVGEGIYVYSSDGRLSLVSGFFRAAETAAWHLAAMICFLILLAVASDRGRWIWWVGGVLILALVGALILAGRRKFLIEIAMFIPLYGALLAYYRRGAARLAALLGVLALGAGWAGALLYGEGIFTSGMDSYYDRIVTLSESPGERLYRMTIGSFRYVVSANGFFGSGAGTGSQGAQYFGGGAALVGGAAEGGLGKVLAELGVPGLVLLLWLGVAALGYVGRILSRVSRHDSTTMRITCGLTAFLLANSVLFLVAHQVFGDLFVLLMLGWTLGFILAVPKLERHPAVSTVPRPGSERDHIGGPGTLVGHTVVAADRGYDV